MNCSFLGGRTLAAWMLQFNICELGTGNAGPKSRQFGDKSPDLATLIVAQGDPDYGQPANKTNSGSASGEKTAMRSQTKRNKRKRSQKPIAFIRARTQNALSPYHPRKM